MESYTIAAIYLEEELPVNFIRGHDYAKEFTNNVDAGLYGKYWTVYEENNFVCTHLETDNATDVRLFKALKALGVTNTLDFAYTMADNTLYVPYKLAELASSTANAEGIKGVFEYICGVAHWMFSLKHPDREVLFETPTKVMPLAYFTELQKASTFKLQNFGPKTLTMGAVESDEYSGPEGWTVFQIAGGAGLDGVAIKKTDESYRVALYTMRKETIDMRHLIQGVFYALNQEASVFGTLKDVDVVVVSTTPPTPVEIVLKITDKVHCTEAARTAFCEAYNFHIKGTKSSKFFEISSVKSEYDDDPIAQELYKTVPDFYKDIDLSDYKHLVKGIANAEIKTAMFFGESGTGKSTIARAIFNTIGIPYAVLNCSVNIEESDIVGTMIPNPHKSSADDPEFIWKDGILTTAVRNGYGIVIEEINFARPGVLGLLNSLLDDAHTLYLPNGESVVAHPNFRMIATGNLGYEGTNRLNAALVNRFNVIHTFDTMSEADAIKAVMKRTGFTNKDQMKKLYTACAVLRKYIKDQNLSGTVSLRQLLNLVSCGKYYESMDKAFVDIVLQGALLEYPEYMEEFRSTVLRTLGLDFALELQED